MTIAAIRAKNARNGSSSTRSRSRTLAAVDDRGRMTADLIAQYMNEVGAHTLLTAEEETELAQLIEAGKEAAIRMEDEPRLPREEKVRLERTARVGERAKDRFISANLRLVVANARRYAGANVEMLDLIQEGNLGLIRAVEKFDWRKGFKFSTYATWWIRQAMARGIAEHARTIRIPVHMHDMKGQVDRTSRELEAELGRPPTPEEIAHTSGLEVSDVEKILSLVSTIALESPVGEDGAKLGDFIPDPDATDMDDHVIIVESAENLREKLLELLPAREARILELRFGLDGSEPRRLEEIGSEFGLTRERIRQLEKLALTRLRHPTAGLLELS